MSFQKEDAIRFLPRNLDRWVQQSSDRLSRILINLHVSPNLLTLLGLLAGLGAGVFFALDLPLGAGLLIIVCGLCDIFDGKVAVHTNRQSLYGAIFDSSLDRYSEFFIYVGLAVHFRFHWTLWVVFFTFLGSTMVSYTRARAEGLGITCQVGIMQRAERMILLCLGSFLGFFLKIFDPTMTAVLVIIALFSNITAIQRILYVRKAEHQKKEGKEE